MAKSPLQVPDPVGGFDDSETAESKTVAAGRLEDLADALLQSSLPYIKLIPAVALVLSLSLLAIAHIMLFHEFAPVGWHWIPESRVNALWRTIATIASSYTGGALSLYWFLKTRRNGG